MEIIILIFIYTIHFANLKVYQNLKTLASIRAEKSATENSLERKKNEQIKGLTNNM